MRYRLFQILQPAEEGDGASRLFDYVLTFLILFSSVVTAAETFDLPEQAELFMETAEAVCVLLFTVEYVLRIATADYLHPNVSKPKAALRFIFSFMGLVDLAAILPWWFARFVPFDLMAIRMLRIVRMFRIFKLGNYTDGLYAVGRTFRAKKHELVSSVVVILILMVVSAVMMYGIENAAQPDVFADVGEAFWWAVCTLTTVGYGDVYPVTVAGKVLAAIISLLGIGLVAVPSGIVSAGFIEQMNLDKEEKDKANYCPNCGKKLD